eukprot:jgi/Galph1/5928/GphlegSOOS_G4572.1
MRWLRPRLGFLCHDNTCLTKSATRIWERIKTNTKYSVSPPKHFGYTFKYPRVTQTILCCRHAPSNNTSGQGNLDSRLQPADQSRNLSTLLLEGFANLFPLWILLGAIGAFFKPSYFLWFKGSHIIWTLSSIMLAMGLTLDVSQLIEVTKNPYPVIFGALAQYSIMPMLGYVISRIFALPTEFAVGICLVACCPGGTASNLVCYLAEANVALSVLMTTVTTLLSVLVTPWLMLLLAGKLIPVPVVGLLMSTIQVVLLPLCLGLVLRLFFRDFVDQLNQWLPSLSVIGVVLICGSIVAENSLVIRQSGFQLLLALSVLHLGGFLLGFFVSKFGGFSTSVCRTVSIEVGMQNSGLGAALAKAHFGNPLTAVPCAISATMHSIYGSLFASYWRWSNRQEKVTDPVRKDTNK